MDMQVVFGILSFQLLISIGFIDTLTKKTSNIANKAIEKKIKYLAILNLNNF